MNLYMVYSNIHGPEDGAGLVYAENETIAIYLDSKSEEGYGHEKMLDADELCAFKLDIKDSLELLRSNGDMDSKYHVVKSPAVMRLAGMWGDLSAGKCEGCDLYEWADVPVSTLCGDCLRCVECGHDAACSGTRPVLEA